MLVIFDCGLRVSECIGLQVSDIDFDNLLIGVKGKGDPDGVEHGFDYVHSRLIGTCIVNEIFDAMSRLNRKGWKGVYYLYIDEVGQFATRSISAIMDLKRKSGLRLTMAHQRFNQFEDNYVRDAVESAGTKILFQEGAARPQIASQSPPALRLRRHGFKKTVFERNKPSVGCLASQAYEYRFREFFVRCDCDDDFGTGEFEVRGRGLGMWIIFEEVMFLFGDFDFDGSV